MSGTKYNADVPKFLLKLAVGPSLSPYVNLISDDYIDSKFNPPLKALFKQVDTSGLQPNQYIAFTVDFGEGIQGRVGYAIDGNGTVYELTGLGVGASVLPVSIGVTVGMPLKQEGYGYSKEEMRKIMEGVSVSFSFQGGTQGGFGWSPASNVVTAEVGGATNAGLGIMGANTHPLFNIND